MRLEDALPYIRMGRRISHTRDDCGIIDYYNEENIKSFFKSQSILSDNWNVVEEKIKKYPILILQDGEYLIIDSIKFTSIDAAKQFYALEKFQVIRIITEIPELITEYVMI